MTNPIRTTPRPNPIRIFGESELRLHGPTLVQIAAMNSRRLRGRFVHRHKSKVLRQHALRPIRRTYQVEQASTRDALIQMSEPALSRTKHRQVVKNLLTAS